MGLALESENGVPATVGADGYGLELTEISAATEPELIEKTVFKASISAGPSRVGKVSASVSVSGELKNSGVAGAAPKIDAILQAARFGRENALKMTVLNADGWDSLVPGKSVISAGNVKGLIVGVEEDNSAIYYVLRSNADFASSAAAASGGFTCSIETAGTAAGFLYRPMSDGESQKTYTLEANDGGLKKSIYGAACTFTMELSTESYPSFSAQFTGVASKDDWGTPFAGLPEGIEWEDHQPGIVANARVRIGNDYAPITSSVSIDTGNEVYLIPDLNSDSWLKFSVITARNATANVAITADIERSASLYQKLFAGEVASMSFKIGEGAGNQIDVLLPAAQYTGITESDDNSMLGQEINLKLTGDDCEIMLWFR
jgi:hypothetical protein